MAGHLTLLRVRGIPLRLHWTFLLALPLFAYLMARAYFTPEAGAVPDAGAWMWGALLAVGLFGSVLLHELSHSLMALRSGIPVRGITLLPIGGVSSFERMPEDPRTELKITVVGPLTNLALALPLAALSYVLPAGAGALRTFLGAFAIVNLALGLFNLLLPAFPMDGGRILRALLARRMDRLRATRIAAGVGRAIAFAMGVFGLFVGAWILVLVAVFVYLGAGQEEQATLVGDALADLRVGDVMTRDVDSVASGASVDAAFQRMLATKHLVLPVVDEGRPVGLVDLETLRGVSPPERMALRVGDVLRPGFESLPPEAEAVQAQQVLARTALPALLVVRGAELVGVVTPTDLVRVAAIRSALRQGGGGRAPSA